jgi:myosin heavy subunit
MQEQYENLTQVLDHVGFSAEETQSMEQLLVTILHIGNIEFNEADDSYAELADASSIEFGTLSTCAEPAAGPLAYRLLLP